MGSARGRIARVLSLGFAGNPIDAIFNVIEKEAAQRVDLIVLPEDWQRVNGGSREGVDGPTITAMSALARKYRTYLVSTIDNNDDADGRLKSGVLLDRDGNVVFVYNQVFPSWNAFQLKPSTTAGVAAPIYEADFGRIGIALGFDVNFPEVWKSLADSGAELVVWPSTTSGGTILQAHALTNHYYIVSATGKRDCVAYDITGEQILYRNASSINVTHLDLDLDRGIYSEDFNTVKREQLLKERGGDIELEKTLEHEGWFVLRARRPGVSARELAKQYGLEELRHYIDRSRSEIDKIRGWSFAERVDQDSEV